MDEDATVMGKPMITMATPRGGVSPPPPCATDTHIAHPGVTFNPTKLPSQIEIQTFKLKKKENKNKAASWEKFLLSILLAFHI